MTYYIKSYHEIFVGVTEMSSVGESGDGQADPTVVAESASAISAYDAGGTMYFYAGGDEMVSSLTLTHGKGCM